MTYLKCLSNCNQEPSLLVPFGNNTLNWLGDSTADQLRIEDVLKAQVTPSSSLLHIGIGDSGLASRFHHMVNHIDGVTLGDKEERLAIGLNLPNYRAIRINKYAKDLVKQLLQPPYDFIIDNNLASYACCVHHFHTLIRNYVSLLKPDGRILTEPCPNGADWNITEDLEAIARKFGFILKAETNSVYSLTLTSEVTLVITSCGRSDLLECTLKSFYRFNTYPIREAIIIEDGSPLPPSFPVLNLKYISNGSRIGQVASIDKAYTEVTTPYIFHCEDDWEFYKPGFIEASLPILEKYPDIIQVWLRAHNDTNQHPIVKLEQYDVPTLKTNYDWHGFSWNPGLRRLFDYQRIGGYSAHLRANSANSEWALGKLYCDLGYHAAILPEEDGWVRHIGWNRGIRKENPILDSK